MRLLPLSPLPLLGCLALLAILSLVFSRHTRASSAERPGREALSTPRGLLRLPR